jgi:hypothetical protein
MNGRNRHFVLLQFCEQDAPRYNDIKSAIGRGKRRVMRSEPAEILPTDAHLEVRLEGRGRTRIRPESCIEMMQALRMG